ncbi:MAG: pimeloyl-CoA dehydrogenase large subunit [Pseudomonadales bacterium]|uniref:acyl-CoA dehydrogenase family protein n=1 Tax=unclassified Ketobacter TaxID=2639109 RepID=UPI000C5A6725|nr:MULTISPECIES: acyl-CoA dehydrogenase family protein [unclassified Ketobacter]MAA60364.1 pimeloyl-CoA dehydrogenase large subunit [Pseudomonadales bacterium]MEC8810528.1 acyl-CoA dehydrogenase family protein [Pseudomonadota bacterium]TNC89735.1 MAG: pimeloyl-CoA dehydrogenase large subunit [Alcanivorax sp.]HAG93136.1 pimeloyl-CoA dehydrogenase large subunit [Gammaproteobacteria bacterium]MAQ25009.1 pimeloyl-CoA dehydrogenase large subunit [Pseudomonadales bacterium]|tara:strand:+ start:40585 stop:41748 length:1164 start_codon:yes stop_codon:yes gene_type:complete
MDIQLTPNDVAFRDEVRAFLKEKLSDRFKRAVVGGYIDKDTIVQWQKILYEKGWIAPSWPTQYGGTGWSITQKFIFENECAEAGAPTLVPFGLKMVGPVIYTFGNEEQKARFLPDILQSNVWWCQGYSEPGAGSDLAALQTRAERDGDDYIVNGQKIWTTYAQHSDWIFCLVRTDGNAKKQEGISFLLIDMNTPGIEVRKIDSIDNQHSLNEVFFDNVKVPVANRIGEENKGWTYAKYLLTHERTAIAGVPQSKRAIERLKQIAAQEISAGKPLIEDEMFCAKLARIEVDLMALEYTELRAIASVADGGAPGPESSILKIRGTEIQQAVAELSVEACGYYAHALGQGVGNDYAAPISTKYLYGRAATIYGGSNEVQKNIIAKMVLGL